MHLASILARFCTAWAQSWRCPPPGTRSGQTERLNRTAEEKLHNHTPREVTWTDVLPMLELGYKNLQ